AIRAISNNGNVRLARNSLIVKGPALAAGPSSCGKRLPATLKAPRTVEQIPGGFKVKDATGQSLAYVYGRETKAELLQTNAISLWSRLTTMARAFVGVAHLVRHRLRGWYCEYGTGGPGQSGQPDPGQSGQPDPGQSGQPDPGQSGRSAIT